MNVRGPTVILDPLRILIGLLGGIGAPSSETPVRCSAERGENKGEKISFF